MKKKYVLLALIASIGILMYLILFVFDSYSKDFNNLNQLAPQSLSKLDSKDKKGIFKISLKQLDSIIKMSNDSLHIYFFTYYCSPCIKSIRLNTFNDVIYKDNQVGTLPTILVSCDNYGSINKLYQLIKESNIEMIYILDNDELPVTSRFNSFERLELLSKRFLHFKSFKDNLGYPFNLVFDDKGNVINSYTGSIEVTTQK